MSSVLLFSQLTETNKQSILHLLMRYRSVDKTFAYMPSGGTRGAEDFIAQWQNIVGKYKAQFSVIDNTNHDVQERNKLLNADILLISGGNTFQLLKNLKDSGLDSVIVEFHQKSESMIAGFSAGALVLTPTINICNLPDFDENIVKLTDLNGLGIVDFEVLPHYQESLHKDVLDEYRKTTGNIVREITDEDHILVNF